MHRKNRSNPSRILTIFTSDVGPLHPLSDPVKVEMPLAPVPHVGKNRPGSLASLLTTKCGPLPEWFDSPLLHAQDASNLSTAAYADMCHIKFAVVYYRYAVDGTTFAAPCFSRQVNIEKQSVMHSKIEVFVDSTWFIVIPIPNSEKEA